MNIKHYQIGFNTITCTKCGMQTYFERSTNCSSVETYTQHQKKTLMIILTLRSALRVVQIKGESKTNI